MGLFLDVIFFSHYNTPLAIEVVFFCLESDFVARVCFKTLDLEQVWFSWPLYLKSSKRLVAIVGNFRT